MRPLLTALHFDLSLAVAGYHVLDNSGKLEENSAVVNMQWHLAAATERQESAG